MAAFEGIVDIYEKNTFDFDIAWTEGIRAVLHETGRGTYHLDSKYTDRKRIALEKGFLWAGFHLLSDESIDLQIATFLSAEPGTDPSVGLAIDWEQPDQHETMPYTQLRDFVSVFAERVGRYPILYGGHLLRETEEILKGDPLLAKCPLWYQRYRDTPLGLPTKTWKTYTLWQFDDEHRQNGAPKNILGGADWNRFQGSFEDLKRAWPFSNQ